MSRIRIMSLNGEDMIDIIPRNLKLPGPNSRHHWRGKLLGAMIKEVNPHIVGLVEAPPDEPRTKKFVEFFLDDAYKVYQGEKRGALGLVFLVKRGLDVNVGLQSKRQSLKDFQLKLYDADGDGIKEQYSWWNRVPLEAEFSGNALADKTTFILIHSKSKGAFIAGDLYAYERLSRANRMKLRAQADAVRKRLDQLIDDNGKGRVVVMGDMNDGPEFDIYAALLGGAFLEPVMGSIWNPEKILYNCHVSMKSERRWTIDFKDRVVNPLRSSRYGQPTELRSWIDHILVSSELKDRIVPDSADIFHGRVKVPGIPKAFTGMTGSDHHPPYVNIDL